MSAAPSILIVEDQAPMRKQLRDFVQLAWPCALIAEAADGTAALAACAAHRPDLVLLDIDLPDVDGISLTAHVRLQLPGAGVIFVSHHAARVYFERAQAAGAFGYVTKDNVATQLLPLIQRALAGRTGR